MHARGRQRLGGREALAPGAGGVAPGARARRQRRGNQEADGAICARRMDKFMQALAEQMRKNPQQLARPLDRNTRMLRQQDLKSMLDRLEQLARSGAKDAARQLLDQLQSMMENLQMAQPTGRQGRRRRYDVGARRARRHDPQAAAIARPHLPAGPGPAPPAAISSSGQQGAATRSATCGRTSRRCAISSTSCWRS